MQRVQEVRKPITILMAEDDPDDRFMTERALRCTPFVNDLRFVKDGQELLDYLWRRGPYSEPDQAPRPGVILLDLNMPRKDGREALAEIKAEPGLRDIPIVVLTTSRSEDDVHRTYYEGASSFIAKPVSFDELVAIMKVFGRYWLEIVELPGEKVRGAG